MKVKRNTNKKSYCPVCSSRLSIQPKNLYKTCAVKEHRQIINNHGYFENGILKIKDDILRQCTSNEL